MLGSLVGAGFLAGALACSNDDDRQSAPASSNDAMSGADASDDRVSDAPLWDGPAVVCPGPSSFTTPDGGDAQPWAGADPEHGESCEVLGGRWADGCRCGKRCECTDAGWVCGYLTC